MRDVRQTEREVVDGFAQNTFGFCVFGLERLRQKARFACAGFANQIDEGTGPARLYQLRNFPVDGPAGATVLEDRAVALKADMANFGFAGSGAVIYFAVDDESAPYAAAEGYVK